jgi:cephalosporin-C deacetylase-like acetyl esterase/lysophospholipase L1-like esterase
MSKLRKSFTFSLFCILSGLMECTFTMAQVISLTPLKPTGIYDLGEKVGWTLAAPKTSEKYSFVLKKNNFETIESGDLDVTSGTAKIETSLNAPAMLYLEVKSPRRDRALIAGAAVAPTKLQPSVARPADFDEFWASKIKLLEQIPPNAVLKPGDSDDANITYSTIRMDNINGSHIYGQLAKPNHPGKFPALLMLQWAGVYPLEKAWAADHAKNGWLTLNISAHDLSPMEPKAYYDALPQQIKEYQKIGNDDRDKSYFLRMYLGDYRAVEYLASLSDWDGKTLVVMGTSMGGQQSLCVAGLNSKITHVIVNEPAGCDTNAALHGRQEGYPNFPSDNPQVMQTALYFDAVNFASRITATSLVAMGFIDTTAPPAGIWTAFNQIKGSKEAAPMINSPHNNLATEAEQFPFNSTSSLWLDTLVHGGAIKPASEIISVTAPPAFDDHQNMMDQLGVRAIRLGPDPHNPDNFDEATANRYKDSMPDAPKLKDGTEVTSADQWPKRRAEILEDFEREIYGRIPANVPSVKWEVTSTTPSESGGIPTVTKTLVGHVDNSAYPKLSVNIEASFTVPANASAKVPIIFTFSGFGPPRPGRRPFHFPTPPGIPWTQQAIEHGWGYGTINPWSIQPDNDQLTTGIIGLTNHGNPRKPDQWGALRAWQWGASRLIDYFQNNPDAMVDATKVGIEGVSRYGKAAIVTEAFEPRIAVALVASSGEGGVKLHRHIFGEAVENLAGGEYYWMAGNFIKYGASDPPMTAADLPVDSHELIALCAPRPCFISYGSQEHGDPKWVDAHGSFMAVVLASPVYELLGKKGLGTPGDYLTDPMPPIGERIGGDLTWRQHNGGHDVTPNWPAFFEWVAQYINTPPLPTKPSTGSAMQPEPRTDANSQLAHQQLLAKAKQEGINIYFLGDSIIRRWGCSDPQYANLLANWKKNFFRWNAADFGWGADQIQNILWRIENGELDNVNPKIIVLLAGTNNLGPAPVDAETIADVTRGLERTLDICHEKAPTATIILTAIFPRNDDMNMIPAINQINANLAKIAEEKRVRFVNINEQLADPTGKVFDGMMNASDKLHPAARGYQVWADALKPIFTELLGAPPATDHAPPPTGDPSAAHPQIQ